MSVLNSLQDELLIENFMSERKTYDTYKEFKNDVDSRKTRRLLILDSPESISYNIRKDLFMFEQNVLEVPTKYIDKETKKIKIKKKDLEFLRRDASIEEYPVLPFAVGHLSQALRINDITTFLKAITEADICLNYNVKREKSLSRTNKFLSLNKKIREKKDYLNSLKVEYSSIKLNADENAIKRVLKEITKIRQELNELKNQKINNVRVAKIFKDLWKVNRGEKTKARIIIGNLVKDKPFGEQIRSYVSPNYIQIPLSTISKDMHDLVKTQNTKINFKNATLRPISCRVNYVEDKAFLVRGDEHNAGYSWSDSNDKAQVFKFSNLIWRQVCSNGMWGITSDQCFTLRHMGKIIDFIQSAKDGITYIMGNTDKYVNLYKKLENYVNPLFDKWEQVFELPETPIKIKNKNLKEKLVDIAEDSKFNYTNDLYGMVNIYSHLGTHESETESYQTTYNERANYILRNMDNINQAIINAQLQAQQITQ